MLTVESVQQKKTSLKRLNNVEWWVSYVWLKIHYFVSLFKPLLTAATVSVVNNCLFYPSKCPKLPKKQFATAIFHHFGTSISKGLQCGIHSCHVFRRDRAATLVRHRKKKDKKTNELWQNQGRNTLAWIWMVLLVTLPTAPLSARCARAPTRALCLFYFGLFCSVSSFSSVSIASSLACQLAC